MLDRSDVIAVVAERLPDEWRRVAAVDDLQHRIVEVLRDPRNGSLDDQLPILAKLLRIGSHLPDKEWLAWATYAFGSKSSGEKLDTVVRS
jgi:hypothetical protein